MPNKTPVSTLFSNVGQVFLILLITAGSSSSNISEQKNRRFCDLKKKRVKSNSHLVWLLPKPQRIVEFHERIDNELMVFWAVQIRLFHSFKNNNNNK
jgi:hypothetical protein